MEVRKQAADTLETAVLRFAAEQPQLGQAKAAAALTRLGHPVSPSGVRYIWRKHGLETTYKRLTALAGKSNWQPSAGQRALLNRGRVQRKVARKSAAAGGEDGAEARRSQILLAAAELYSQHGYAGTSMRDIARMVGLLAGSVYHHFPAKEDLFVAVHQEGFRQLVQRIEAKLGTELDPWRRLEIACAEHIAAITGDNPIHQMTGTSLFAIHEPQLQQRVAVEREAYEKIFRRLIAALELPRGIDRSLFRLSLLGALNWSLVWYRSGKKTPQDIARRMMTVFGAGLIQASAAGQPPRAHHGRSRPAASRAKD